MSLGLLGDEVQGPLTPGGLTGSLVKALGGYTQMANMLLLNSRKSPQTSCLLFLGIMMSLSLYWAVLKRSMVSPQLRQEDGPLNICVGGFLPLLCLREAGAICMRTSIVGSSVVFCWTSASCAVAGKQDESQAPPDMSKLLLVVLADAQGEPKPPISAHAVER